MKKAKIVAMPSNSYWETNQTLLNLLENKHKYLEGLLCSTDSSLLTNDFHRT